MKNFYTSLIIIAVSGILITLYYVLKNLSRRYRARQAHKNIWHKLYADERTFIESQLRFTLGQLAEQKIQWVICHSRNYPDLKIQFIYSALEGQIQMDVLGHDSGPKLAKHLGDAGVVSHRYSGNLVSILVPVNAKMVADIIAQCFLFFTDRDKILNLSIKTSGV